MPYYSPLPPPVVCVCACVHVFWSVFCHIQFEYLNDQCISFHYHIKNIFIVIFSATTYGNICYITQNITIPCSLFLSVLDYWNFWPTQKYFWRKEISDLIFIHNVRLYVELYFLLLNRLLYSTKLCLSFSLLAHVCAVAYIEPPQFAF